MAHKDRIRFATVSDLEALVRLEELAFKTDRFTEDQIDYLLTRSRATTFIIENKSSVVGAACVLWRKSHQSARLYNIVVDPTSQAKGYGLRLMKECELEAARRGCEKITLEVRQDNDPAIRFYKKYGFDIMGTLHDYYSDGSAGIKMSKHLNLKIPAKLNYDVPYYAQTLDFTCGPACLMMALKYFKPTAEFTRALEMILWKEATLIFMASGYAGTDGYGLALSALSRGLSCRAVMSTDRTPMLRSVRRPEKREVMKVVHNDMKNKALLAGLSTAIYEYGIDEIISALHRAMLPVVLISTYRLTGDRVPHWVIVTGFDQKNVYIHDPDAASYKKIRTKPRHLRIEKTEFLRMTRYGKEVYRSLILIGSGK